MGCQKLGQPVPDSNFVLESKRTVLQQMQWYSPSSWLLAYLPVNGRSVPARRVTSNCSAVNCAFHSDSGLDRVRRRGPPRPRHGEPEATPAGRAAGSHQLKPVDRRSARTGESAILRRIDDLIHVDATLIGADEPDFFAAAS